MDSTIKFILLVFCFFAYNLGLEDIYVLENHLQYHVFSSIYAIMTLFMNHIIVKTA